MIDGPLLEARVRETREGALSIDSLFEDLLRSQVCLLAARPVDEDDPSSLEPLVLGTPSGGRAIAVFTSDERAAPVVARFPSQPHGVIVDFGFVLEGTDASLGVSVNPGWPMGIDLPAAEVDRLARAWGSRRA